MKKSNLIMGALMAIVIIAGVAIAVASMNSSDTTGNDTLKTYKTPERAPTTLPIVSLLIKKSTYGPATVRAKVGDTLGWTNEDTVAHTILFDDPSIADSGEIQPSAVFKATFTKAGNFSYHDAQNASMTGTVIVE